MKKRKLYKKIGVFISIALVVSVLQIPEVKAEEERDITILEDVKEDTEESSEEVTESSKEVEESTQEDNNKVDEQNLKSGVELQQETDGEFLAEKEDRANSWRFNDGELIPQKSNRAAYTTWPTVDGAVANGIDVSVHNGSIDWSKAKKSGVDYAIIRCGYGMNQTDQDDSQWKNNVEGCIKNGIPFGVYIYSYADSVERAKSEAEHVLRLVKGYHMDYPVYYDLEEKSVRDKLSTTQIADIAEVFCDKIENAGYNVAIYANKDWFSNYLTDERFSKWDRWVAQYNTSCTYEGKYTMWQCSSSGIVNGIGGQVDLNIDFGSSMKKEHIPEETYTISSAVNSNKILSVQEASTNNGAGIVISGDGKVQSFQRFEIISNGGGYYRIVSESSGKVLEVSNGSYEAGTAIQQNEWDGSEKQLWSLVDAGDGYYYLHSKLGMYLDLKNGSIEEGNSLQTYTWNGSNAQKWKLNISDYQPISDGIYTFSSCKDSGKVLDIKNGSISNGANVQIYSNNETFPQQFSVSYEGKGYYKIIAENSMKALDVAAASKKPGANLQQYGWNGSNAQLWKFVDAGNGEWYIKSKLGTTIELGGNSVNNGTNVQMGNMNYDVSQKWNVMPLNQRVLQPVKDGTYVIKSAVGKQKVLTQKNNNIQINLFENIAEQKFKIQYISNGYYKIIDTATNKVLDVSNGSASAGANLWEYASNNSDAQKWRFGRAGDGGYFIKSKLGTFVELRSGSAVENNNVQLYSYNGSSAAQKWILDSNQVNAIEAPIADGTYIIRTAVDSGKVLDINGGSLGNSANVQLYSYNNTSAQRVEITHRGNGYYKILFEKSGKAMDIAGAKTVAGTNVQQYEWNGSNAQLWKFIDVGDGTYYMKSKLGTVLDVAGGKAVNKTNIQMYTANETAAQKWIIEEAHYRPVAEGIYTFQSRLNSKMVMDVKGGVITNSGNIQLYTSNKSDAQKFKVSYEKDGFYKIASVKSGKALDVKSASMANGANVQQYAWNGSDAQRWKFIDAGNGCYYIRSKLGKTIDIAGAKTKNGTNIQVYSANGTNAQKWLLNKEK